MPVGLGLGLNLSLVGGRPGWVLAGASVDMDFANSRVYGGTFTTLLSCSRAQTVSSYALNSAGVYVPFNANTLRITDLGLLIEEARTNVVLWNRDLTNAAWTASNVTVAKDQTGADGTANAASSLTATAGNGTVLQAITLASSARWQSVVAKRLVGTGNIQMTMDNGSTWINITLTANYQQLSIPTQTLANPTVGFRIVTSGDSFAVDFVQNTAGAFSTSPIPTTTAAVTRNADVITLTGAALTAALNAKAEFFQTSGVGGTPAGLTAIRAYNDNSFPLTFQSATTIRFTGSGGNATATIGGGGTSAGSVKMATGSDASGISVIANGGTKVTSVGTVTTSSPVILGNRAAGTWALNGYMLRAAFGPTKGMFDGLTS